MVATDEMRDLKFREGDHVCAFYNGTSEHLDDIVVDFVSQGLNEQDKCICFVDSPESVRARISPEMLVRENILQIFTEEEGYLPTGDFSIDAFIGNLDQTAQGVLDEGYRRLRLIGDTSVVARKAVDLKAWLSAEAQVSEIAQRYPHYIMCLYNLDLYDGDMVMYVLKTHTKIFVNGLIIENPYYIPQQRFLEELP